MRRSCSNGSASASGSIICLRSFPAARCNAPRSRTVAGGPSILLADEPTGNLDAVSGMGVIELLRDLNRERGLTMIMVTHDAQIAQQADRVVRLAEGRVEEFSPAFGLA